MDEWPPLKELMPHFNYTGVDASEVALNAARRTAPKHYNFIKADLSRAAVQVMLPAAELVISRRCLQNLPVDSRARLAEQLGNYNSGILVECTVEGMQRTNRLRQKNGHGPLTEPEFNKYLSAQDIADLWSAVDVHDFGVEYPFSQYYKLTRGEQNSRNCPHAYRENGRSTRVEDKGYGPLAVFTWGRP